jgi:hypothetical protein
LVGEEDRTMRYKPMDYRKADGTPCYKNGSTVLIPCPVRHPDCPECGGEDHPEHGCPGSAFGKRECWDRIDREADAARGAADRLAAAPRVEAQGEDEKRESEIPAEDILTDVGTD